MEPHITAIRCVSCHMGSHSVTCHPTQVNTPHLNPSQTGRTRFIYLNVLEGAAVSVTMPIVATKIVLVRFLWWGKSTNLRGPAAPLPLVLAVACLVSCAEDLSPRGRVLFTEKTSNPFNPRSSLGSQYRYYIRHS